MRKVLLGLLLLAVAAPAFAAVTVTTASAPGQVTVTLTAGAGENIVGIGLLVDATAGVVDSYTVDSFFDIFIDHAYTMETATPGSYTYGAGAGANNTKGANPTAPGISVTLPSAAPFSISVGGLGGAVNPLAPAPQVANIVLKSNGGATVDLAVDTYRGGIVSKTAGAHVVTGLPLTGVVIGADKFITGTPVVSKPTNDGFVNGGRSETFVASGVTGSGTLEYQFTWGDSTVGAWGPATQTKTYTYTAAGTYNVTVQARLQDTPAMVSAVSAPKAVVREAYKSTGTAYATWVAFNRPSCWAFKRNCRGDGDGVGTGIGVNKIWVTNVDLNIVAAAFNVTETPLKTKTYLAFPAICGDNDRLGTGIGVNKIWVNSTDLTTFAGYFNKTEASVPLCPTTNVHFNTN